MEKSQLDVDPRRVQTILKSRQLNVLHHFLFCIPAENRDKPLESLLLRFIIDQFESFCERLSTVYQTVQNIEVVRLLLYVLFRETFRPKTIGDEVFLRACVQC